MATTLIWLDVLQVAQEDIPEAAPNEVLVEVHATGLDRGTEHLMTGKPYLVRLATGLRRPKKPVSGRSGPRVQTAVKPGPEVGRWSRVRSRHPCLRPRVERCEVREQQATLFGQGVALLGAGDKPCLFQFANPLRQHARRDATTALL